jgi:hypothetical protein
MTSHLDVLRAARRGEIQDMPPEVAFGSMTLHTASSPSRPFTARRRLSRCAIDPKPVSGSPANFRVADRVSGVPDRKRPWSHYGLINDYLCERI